MRGLAYSVVESGRLAIGAVAIVIGLVLGALFVPGMLETHLGVAPVGTPGVGSERQSDSPLRARLAPSRVARGDAGLRLANHAKVDRAAPPAEAARPAPAPGPASELIAAVAPAAEAPQVATKAPGTPTPGPSPNPAPAPPEPVPIPPGPAPTPEPAPATPPPAPSPAPSPTPAPPPDSGKVLFKATFDRSGFSGWYVQSLPGRTTVTSVDPFEGLRAARFEVRDGDVEPDTGSERSEVSGPTFNEGEDLYIRDAIRFPSTNTYSVPWQIVQQLHEEDWSGSPGLAVFLDNKPSLKLGAGDPPPTYWQSATLEHDRWYDLVYRVYLSQDPSAGFVEVWLDGVPQTLLNGQARMYGRTIQAPQAYIKAGIYRSRAATGTSIVEHDTIVIGTSLAAVMAG